MKGNRDKMNYFVAKVLFGIPLRFQLSRNKAFARVFNFVYFNKIDGDYLEFGVARGSTMKMALNNARVRRISGMNFYGVDTFEGFPETIGPETSFRTYRNIVGSRVFSIDTLEEKLGFKGIENLKFLKLNMENGDLQKLHEFANLSNLAVIHLDMDYYLPTYTALMEIHKGFKIGTILMFDNFFFFSGSDLMGERKALSDFRKRHINLTISEYFNYGWHGKAFIVSNTATESIDTPDIIS